MVCAEGEPGEGGVRERDGPVEPCESGLGCTTDYTLEVGVVSLVD